MLTLGLMSVGNCPAEELPPANLAASLSVDQDNFVLGEPVRCQLVLENRGYLPVVFDDYGPYLQNRVEFDLRRQPDRTVRRFDADASILRLMLMPGEKQVLSVNLSQHYPLVQEGRYYLRAVIYAAGERLETPLRMFDVVTGLELERVTAQIIGTPGRQRTYRLVYWPRERGESLFLRVSDAPGDAVLETVVLGRLVRVTPPSIQVGADGRVMIRHQASRDVHVLTVLESRPEGLRMLSQTVNEDHGTTPLRRALQQEREASTDEPMP